jgi:ribonuclease III
LRRDTTMKTSAKQLASVISGMREQQGLKDIKVLEKRLRYAFSDRAMLATALTHSSAIRDLTKGLSAQFVAKNLQSNERLEFLGDSVLNLSMATLLMERRERFSEGELSKIRASLVSEKPLAEIATSLDLSEFILLGRSEMMGGGRNRSSILADGLEAIIGAIYTDGGYDKAFAVVKRLFLKSMAIDTQELLNSDSKSMLQEYTQERFKLSPSYEVISESGPAHERLFEVAVRVKESVVGSGSGTTKKRASQEAAKQAYERLAGESI